MTARERAEALRVALMKNMESRKGFHRVDIDRETIAEWDGEWDSLIASALADAERSVGSKEREFIEWARDRQPAMLELMRKHDLKIDNLDDPIQKFTFTLYTELCEVNFKARHLIEAMDTKVQMGEEG